MSTQFGLNESSRLVHVSEAVRGLACRCHCVVCDEPLIARKGEVREHHFAHASNKEPCEANHESLLHRYAKQVIAEAGGLVLPVPTWARTKLGLDAGDDESIFVVCTSVLLEQPAEELRVDLLAATDLGVVFAIEVAYSSFCDLEKRSRLADLDLPTLEIDLRLFTPAGFDPDEVRDAVVCRVEGKSWIHPFEPAPTHDAPPVTSPLPLETAAHPAAFVRQDPQAAVAGLPLIKPRLPEEIIIIAGRWVSIRKFESGDIAVKVVRYDPDIVSLVKSICRPRHAKYNPKYRSWNVPCWSATAVREDLRAASETFRIGVINPWRVAG